MSEVWFELLLAEVRRRLLEESRPRLESCLARLSEAEVWYRPNPQSNSVGNLVLHLCGNLRQWVVAGLGGAVDVRQRSAEFAELGPLSKAELLTRWQEVLDAVQQTLDQLSPERLVQTYHIQGFQENGISVLVHVVEHCSYHVGQISYFTKAQRGEDLGYYAGVDLEAG